MNDRIDLLIQLAEESGLTELVGDFRMAMKEEVRHLEQVRNWARLICMEEAKLEE